MFQHTAARRRLVKNYDLLQQYVEVSTHSRPKAAGTAHKAEYQEISGFNTQPPEGGWLILRPYSHNETMFQHTAARRRLENMFGLIKSTTRFQHTAARRRLVPFMSMPNPIFAFQHTAARRRLDEKVFELRGYFGFNTQPPEGGWVGRLWLFQRQSVSTHSRPKAAGCILYSLFKFRGSFNTQPPEGGWSLSQKPCSIRFRSPDFARLPRKARTQV